MERRNFYILIASLCIGMSIFWLTLYNVERLGISPTEYVEDQIKKTLQQEPEKGEIVVIIKGDGVKENLELSIEELESKDYIQVKDKEFHFKNRVGREWEEIYSGTSLWSILIENDILKSSAKTFTFVGEDGYESPKPLELSKAEENEKLVIIAYEEDGYPIYEEGPVKSAIDQSVIPDLYSSQFRIKNLEYVIIDD